VSLAGLPSHAQDSNVQSEIVDVNRFDRKAWEEVVGSTDYSEDQERAQQSKVERSDTTTKSSDKRVKSRERSNGRNNEDDESSSGFSLSSDIRFDYIIYALVAGVIIYILFLIIRNISVKSDRKVVPNSPSLINATFIDNIRELETDRLVREAIASGNYRLAVRICFLGMLKTLDENGVINWKKDKTNRDYLSELLLKQYHYDEIRLLTINYEQVWYGEHDLSLNAYEQVIDSFKSMGDKLNSSKSA